MATFSARTRSMRALPDLVMLYRLRNLFSKPTTVTPSITITKEDRWTVTFDGVPVATLDDPVDEDQFWFVWRLTPLEGVEQPADLWMYAGDERRGFVHAVTGESDPTCFPGGGDPFRGEGRVSLRGPHRGRGDSPTSTKPEPTVG